MSSTQVAQLVQREISEAQERVYAIASRTPIIQSEICSDGALSLKLEHVQPTGSFKIRGATNALLSLDKRQQELGVVCCSTGNHGRALAYAAGTMGIPITVCLSTLVPPNKVSLVRASGADIIQKGNSQDDALEVAIEFAETTGAKLIPPFDDPLVIGGQGTIGLEIIEQMPTLDTLLIPLSGGGLAGGVAAAIKNKMPHVRIIGLSMDRGAAMYESLRQGAPVSVPEYSSLADSLGGGIGLNNQYTLSLCRQYLDEVVLVTEEEIYEGMRALYWQDLLVAEGACAVGVAAILAGKVKLTGPTLSIITGRNVDPTLFSKVIAGSAVDLDGVCIGGTSP